MYNHSEKESLMFSEYVEVNETRICILANNMTLINNPTHKTINFIYLYFILIQNNKIIK